MFSMYRYYSNLNYDNNSWFICLKRTTMMNAVVYVMSLNVSSYTKVCYNELTDYAHVFLFNKQDRA